jgi:hypothetical protein
VPLLDGMTKQLRPWLAHWLPLYEPLVDARARRAGTAADRAVAQKAATDLQNEIGKNPASTDLRALDTMVRNHGITEVRGWQREFSTIPPEVIDSFRDLGIQLGARSGSEYQGSKDLMHLELDPRLVLPGHAGPARPSDLRDVVPLPPGR